MCDGAYELSCVIPNTQVRKFNLAAPGCEEDSSRSTAAPCCLSSWNYLPTSKIMSPEQLSLDPVGFGFSKMYLDGFGLKSGLRDLLS